LIDIGAGTHRKDSLERKKVCSAALWVIAPSSLSPLPHATPQIVRAYIPREQRRGYEVEA
jgi:hypothetical protein